MNDRLTKDDWINARACGRWPMTEPTALKVGPMATKLKGVSRQPFTGTSEDIGDFPVADIAKLAGAFDRSGSISRTSTPRRPSQTV